MNDFAEAIIQTSIIEATHENGKHIWLTGVWAILTANDCIVADSAAEGCTTADGYSLLPILIAAAAAAAAAVHAATHCCCPLLPLQVHRTV